VDRALGGQQSLPKEDDHVEWVVEVCSLPAGGEGFPNESRHAPMKPHGQRVLGQYPQVSVQTSSA
jgi:hypothetical protein